MQIETVNKFFVGVTLSSALPILNIIAKQQRLKLGRVRELNIAKSVLVNSVINN